MELGHDDVVLGLAASGRTAALELAGDLAALRHRRLRVVHAVRFALPTARGAGGRPVVSADPRGKAVVNAAVDAVLAAHPGLHVTGHLVTGEPSDLLVEFSSVADTVVVGLRGAGGLADLVVGSTTTSLAARASCPVVAVPATFTGAPGHDVVVGIDGRPESEPVVAEAFRLATETGERLIAVHAWVDPATLGHGAMLPLVHDRRLVSDEEERLLATSVAGWAEKYPDVVVDLRTVRERPTVALLAAAAHARLLVVGRHGHPRARSLVLGSVSQAALHHAPCPVVVVPPDGTK
jgi:nucleotide-binding universal stress UspA family protein